LPPPAERVLIANRLTLSPGGWKRAPAVYGPRLLFIEAGTAVVAVAPDGEGAALPDANTPTLGMGDRLVVQKRKEYVVLNPGPEPAILLEVIVADSAAQLGPTLPSSQGVTTQFLAGGPTLPLPTGSVDLTIGKATLAPHALLAWSATTPLILVVESGTLGLAAEASSTWVHRLTGEAEHPIGVATLVAGDGALVAGLARAEVRNAGDAPVKVLIVTPLGASGEPIPTG
jgi:hypothetical protein